MIPESLFVLFVCLFFGGVEREKCRSFHVDLGPETERAGKPTLASLDGGTWRLRVSEAERRARPGRCVKLKTVTEIKRNSACDTFIAQSVYLVLNSLRGWTMERLKQRSHMLNSRGVYKQTEESYAQQSRRLQTD